MLHNDNHLHKYSGIWWCGMVMVYKSKIYCKLNICPYCQLGQGLIKTWNIYKWVFCKNVDKRWKGENVNECLTCLDMLDKRAAVDFIFGNIYVCLCCNCFMHHAWYLDKWYEVFFLAIKSYLSPISCSFLL